MAYLTGDEITEVVDAALAAGLGNNAARLVLLSAVNQDFANGNFFDNGGPARLQLYADLGVMNAIEQLVDGSVPLRDWLRRAGDLARGSARIEANVFTKFETRIAALVSGQPAVPNPASMREVVNNEDIVHRDDMVDFLFLAAGSLAGKSVAKLLVSRYETGAPVFENGKPRRTMGTGWLITDRLVMTNHHVIQFRKRGEAAATDADLKLQGEHAIVRLDYDDSDDVGVDLEVDKLEAWDKDLDFAILRLKEAVARAPLQIQKEPVVFSPGMYLPVNIIQHPAGNPKRVARLLDLVAMQPAPAWRREAN